MTHDSTTTTAHEKISTRTLARRLGWLDGAEHATTTFRESGPRLEALYDGTVEEVAGDDLSDLVVAWRWNDSSGEAAAIASVPARWRRQYERAYQRGAASTMRAHLDAETDDGEDDGQPSDLQEHEDFAHDNDF